MKKLIILVFVVFLSVGGGCNRSEPSRQVADSVVLSDATTSDVHDNKKPTVVFVEDLADVPENWLVYRDEEYAFEFRYPADAEVDVDADEGLIAMTFLPANQPDEGFSAVKSRKMILFLDDAKRGEQCVTDSAMPYEIKEPKKFGDNIFCFSAHTEGAAGTMYHEYEYVIPKDDVELSFSFTIPESNCNNYPNPGDCAWMDEKEETELFKQIVSTYHNIDERSQSLTDEGYVNVVERAITRGDENYTIDITYPYFSTNTAAYDELNHRIELFVNEELEWFEVDAQNADYEFEVGKWYLGYDYTVADFGVDYVSLLFEGSVYAGGAHPLPLYKTLIFDLKKDEEVALGELFEDDFDYLDFLSIEAKKKLPPAGEFSDEDWVADGTLPAEENFELYYIEAGALKIIFPPYQVAPYAAGAQRIAFDIDELKEYLSDLWLKRLTQN